MKKMYKSRNEENLLPFHIIKAASEGDVSAINTVLKHYEGSVIMILPDCKEICSPVNLNDGARPMWAE